MKIPIDPKTDVNMTQLFDAMFAGQGYVVLLFEPMDTKGVVLMSNVAHAKILEVMNRLKKEIERVHHSH